MTYDRKVENLEREPMHAPGEHAESSQDFNPAIKQQCSPL